MPPSHWTMSQAARITGMAKATIHYHMEPGGELEAEVWHGTRMIPDWRVVVFQERRQKEPK